jgi:hypothetical protein
VRSARVRTGMSFVRKCMRRTELGCVGLSKAIGGRGERRGRGRATVPRIRALLDCQLRALFSRESHRFPCHFTIEITVNRASTARETARVEHGIGDAFTPEPSAPRHFAPLLASREGQSVRSRAEQPLACPRARARRRLERERDQGGRVVTSPSLRHARPSAKGRPTAFRDDTAHTQTSPRRSPSASRSKQQHGRRRPGRRQQRQRRQRFGGIADGNGGGGERSCCCCTANCRRCCCNNCRRAAAAPACLPRWWAFGTTDSSNSRSISSVRPPQRRRGRQQRRRRRPGPAAANSRRPPAHVAARAEP